MQKLLDKIKLAPYNPRSMSKEAKKALKKSMEEFEDISGIVVNLTTMNIVSGNHRYTQLKMKHKNLEYVAILDDLYSINGEDGPTGFTLRTVNWDEEKEKAANIAANSDLISGEFTSGLQKVLSEIMETNYFEELRFDELSIDLSGLNDDLDLDGSDDVRTKIQKDSEKTNRELKESKTEEASDVRIVLTQIKISVPGDLVDEIKSDLKKFLAKKYYAGDITVI